MAQNIYDEDLKAPINDENIPLDEERFEPIQKAFYLKINLLVAILLVVFSIVLAVLAFIKYHNSDLGPFLIYGIVLCFAIISSAISFLFAKSSRTAILNGLKPDKNALKKGEITFILTMTVALLWGIVLPVCFLWSFNAIYLGKNWDESSDYLWVFLTIGTVALLLYCYLIFVSWTVAVRKVNIRILGSICLVGIGAFALLTIWFADNSLEYENQRIVSIIGLGPLRSAYFFSVVVLLLTLGAFVAFILRLRIFFLIVGGVFLFFAAFFIIHSGMVFRKADQIKEGYGSNCHRIMSWTHMDEATHQGCPKYLDTTCKASDQALKWEQDIGVENSKKKNDLACLNLSCCSKITGNSCKNVFRAGASIWGMAVFCFALSASCLFLTQKEMRDKKKTKKPIYFVITAIILVVICVVAIIVVETTRHKPKSEQPLVAAELTSILPFKESSVDKPYQLGVNGCSGIYNQMTASQKNELICTACKGIRVSFKVHKGAKIVLNNGFNSNDLYIFSENHGTEIYPSSNTFTYRTFLMVEGSSDNLKKFLENEALLCPGKGNTYEYTFNSYQMPNARKLSSVPSCNLSHGNQHGCSEQKRENIEIEENTLKLISAPTEDAQKQLTDNYKWKHITIRVYNAMTALPESDVTVYVVPGVSVCRKISTRGFDVIKTVNDKEGFAHLYNVLIKDHTIIVRKWGYKANCKKIEITEGGDYVYSIPIVEEYNIKHLGVLLETSIETDIQLASTFNYDDKTFCNSAFFQHACGYMNYNQKVTHKDRNYQVLNLDLLGEYTYLFYWIVIDGKDKAITNLKTLSFFKSNVYLQKYEFPIEIEEKKPDFVTGMENDEYPTYLSFCMNGKEGDASYSKINKYWVHNSVNPSIYEKSVDDKRELPTADICVNHYKK